uniref:Uncharacterized protein n=1 Tax=viral metagenome TaxID=1070528 RepID=A0A6C0ADL6_9ZZZZ
MQVQINNLPKFFKNSKFYENLDINDDEVIIIPNLKIDDEILNFIDFKNLVETIDFFDCYKYPKSLIKYYKNNSQEVFDFLKSEPFKNEIMLKKFCNLIIKNYKQFFVTYKIINLYKLNPEDCDNYINYALNNSSELISDKGYLIYDYEYANLVNKITSTKILELNPKHILEGQIYLHSNLKKLEKYSDFPTYSIKGVSIIRIECFDEILEAIKYDCKYEYGHQYQRKRFPLCSENKLFLHFKTSEEKSTILPIEINEFNRNNIFEEFQKVIEWFCEESKNLEDF